MSQPSGQGGDTRNDTGPLPSMMQRGLLVGNPLLGWLRAALQPVCSPALQPVLPLQEIECRPHLRLTCQIARHVGPHIGFRGSAADRRAAGVMRSPAM